MRNSRFLTGLRSTRVRAGLGLGVVVALGVTGTFAYWTDDVTIAGTTLTSGTLDLNVNGNDPATSSTLSMSTTKMAPGNSSAEVFTLNNAGTVPLKWTLAGGLTGANATDFGTANALTISVLVNGTRSGSGNTATCTGGTAVATGTALTATTSTGIVSTRQGPIAAGSSATTVCIQLSFDSNAATSLQNKTTDVALTFTGTSDVS